MLPIINSFNMKNITSNEMQKIQGGISMQAMCFGLGLATAFSFSFPPAGSSFITYTHTAIKYCWRR